MGTVEFNTVEEYIAQLPEEHKGTIRKLREIILSNLPEGFEETINYGMIGYVVPLSLYPAGYLNDPKQPLPYINIASQKNHIAVYHMGLVGSKKLNDWFVAEYQKSSTKKLDMGKSCIRFKKTDQIPIELIGKSAAKITPQQWIEIYERGRSSKHK